MADELSNAPTPPSGGGGTLQGSQKNDPVTAIIKGVVDIGNNVINNLFNRKKVNAEIALKENEQKYRQALSTLDNQQKYVLQQALNNAKTASERLKILEDSVVAIKIAKINAGTQATNTTVYYILGASTLLILLLIVIKKTD